MAEKLEKVRKMGMLPENKYQVTPDGLIFTIQDDGTIRKLAKISPNGDVEQIGARKIPQEDESNQETKSSGGGLAAGFIIILIIGLVIAIARIVQCENDKSYLNSRLNSLEYANRDLVTKKQTLESEKQTLEIERENLEIEKNKVKAELKAWGDEYPIIIKDIQVRNAGESYNQTIYSENTTYIYPKIVYKSLETKNVKFDVKFLGSNGLRMGEESKNGYSYFSEQRVYKGDGEIELAGWGGTDKGHWSTGRYGYEIWCNGHMLKDKVFYIK